MNFRRKLECYRAFAGSQLNGWRKNQVQPTLLSEKQSEEKGRIVCWIEDDERGFDWNGRGSKSKEGVLGESLRWVSQVTDNDPNARHTKIVRVTEPEQSFERDVQCNAQMQRGWDDDRGFVTNSLSVSVCASNESQLQNYSGHSTHTRDVEIQFIFIQIFIYAKKEKEDWCSSD